VGPDKAVKLSFLYPATTGRNMDEVLRAVDSLLTAAKHGGKVATPANWKPGDRARRLRRGGQEDVPAGVRHR
jgi:1-Cys peroxiredoxin 6